MLDTLCRLLYTRVMSLVYRSFLEDDERVLKVFRKPIIFITHIVVLRACLWALLVLGVWYFYPAYNFEKRLWFDLNYVWQGLAGLGALHALGPVFFWYMNALVMTNESLIIIEWPKLFVRKSTRIDFHNLDEIAVERIGFKSFLLNYGNVILSKVNGGDEHQLPRMSRPGRVAKIIENYRENYLDHKNFTEESALKGLLSNMVQRQVGDEGQPDRVVYRSAPRVVVEEPPDEAAEVISRLAKAPSQTVKKVFRRQNFEDLPETEIEKRLDDTGGIDLDLDR